MKTMQTLLRVCGAGLLLTGIGWAQGNQPVVTAHIVMATDAAHADSPLRVAVLAQVAPGYHVNSHKPNQDYLIPTRLDVSPNDQFTVKNVIYPKGTDVRFVFSDAPLSVYQGDVAVGVLLQPARTVAPGAYTLKAKLAYQACNDHACLPPGSVPLTLNINVVERNVRLKDVDPNVFARIKFE